MTISAGFRLLALLCVGAAVVLAQRAPVAPAACGSDVGACVQPGLPRCGTVLGSWRVARSRNAGLPVDASHSACIRAAASAGRPAGTRGTDPTVSIAPQPVMVSGDTLVSRAPAAQRDAQRATVRVDVVGAVPDHWDFAIAGTFLDSDTAHGCSALDVHPPVNAGYAVIGGNWERRPHGFYFERLPDACVFDGGNPACPGAPAFIAHEFVPDESFAIDLSLRADDDGWWLEATVMALAPPGATATDASLGRPLGRMRQRVSAPCWLAPGAPGNALFIVIPSPDPPSDPLRVRVDVSGFAWLDPAAVRS